MGVVGLILVWFTSLSCFGADAPTSHADEMASIEAVIRSGKVSEALSQLQKVKRESKYYGWSIQESAKLLYSTERWSEFFGIAFFCRKGMPASLECEKVRLLEILALLRHCQIPQAKEVLNYRPLPRDTALKGHFEVLNELLNVPGSVSKNEKPEDKTEKAKGVFAKANQWPAASLSIGKLDPYRLRRQVKPECGKKEAK